MAVQLGTSLLRVGSIVVLARLLLPEDFGLLAMVTVVTVFVERFKDLGLSDATVQTRAITHSQVNSLFWLTLAVSVGSAFLLASLSKLIAWFYQEPRLTAVSLVLASTFLFSGLVVQHQALLRRKLRFGTLALIQLFSVVLSIPVAIALAYSGFGYWALVGKEFSRVLFEAFGTWLLCPWRPGLPERGVCLDGFLSFGKHVTGFNLMCFFASGFDRVLIGKLYGSHPVGLYTNAFQLLALPMNQIQYPVKVVALPALSALQAEPSSFRAYYNHMQQVLTFFSMPFVVFTALFADVIIDLILGPRWADAVPIFRVLAVGAFLEPVAHPIGPTMLASGRTREYFNVGVITSLLLLACLIAGSFWGVMGVAIGHSIAASLAVVYSLAYGLSRTCVDLVPVLQGAMRTASCSLLAALVLLIVRYATGWSVSPQFLPLFVLLGAFSYIGVWLLVPGGQSLLRAYWGYATQGLFGRRA